MIARRNAYIINQIQKGIITDTNLNTLKRDTVKLRNVLKRLQPGFSTNELQQFRAWSNSIPQFGENLAVSLMSVPIVTEFLTRREATNLRSTSKEINALIPFQDPEKNKLSTIHNKTLLDGIVQYFRDKAAENTLLQIESVG